MEILAHSTMLCSCSLFRPLSLSFSSNLPSNTNCPYVLGSVSSIDMSFSSRRTRKWTHTHKPPMKKYANAAIVYVIMSILDMILISCFFLFASYALSAFATLALVTSPFASSLRCCCFSISNVFHTNFSRISSCSEEKNTFFLCSVHLFVYSNNLQ